MSAFTDARDLVVARVRALRVPERYGSIAVLARASTPRGIDDAASAVRCDVLAVRDPLWIRNQRGIPDPTPEHESVGALLAAFHWPWAGDPDEDYDLPGEEEIDRVGRLIVTMNGDAS